MRAILLCLVVLGVNVSNSSGAAATSRTSAENVFAFKLFETLGSMPGNLVLSPQSIHTALAMTNLGARGETRKQMSAALYGSHAPPPAVREGEVGTLKSANGLWIQNGFSIDAVYEAAVKNCFDGQLAGVDFKNDPEKVRSTINDWVAKQTVDKIANLFSAGSIKSSDRMLLVNAIYFKGVWVTAFAPAATRDVAFHVNGTTSADVPMLHQRRSFSYFENADVQCVWLPYAGDDESRMSMCVVLSRKPDGLPAVEKMLPTAFADWSDQSRPMSVELSLPKWKSTSALHLIPALKSMGMENAFTRDADFSGISQTPLVIGDVVHQAMITVDEEGTEAAAATGVHMRVMSARAETPVTMTVDRPFFYMILRHSTDANDARIVFMGRVCDPRG